MAVGPARAARGLVGLYYYYHPAQHLWLTARMCDIHGIRIDLQSRSGDDHDNDNERVFSKTGQFYTCQIGVTERGFEDIGDISNIRRMLPHDTDTVKANDKIMKIEWEGHAITNADELYHTVWETFTDETIIRSPIAGKIQEILVSDSGENDGVFVDESSPLISMVASQEALLEAQRGNLLVSEMDYWRHIESIPTGKFEE